MCAAQKRDVRRESVKIDTQYCDECVELLAVSQIHVPAELRQRYGSLSDSELKTVIRQTLETPGKQADEAMKHWLVTLSIAEVRPPAKSNVSTMQRRQWVAFALRYLEPLTVGGTDPNTRAAVLDELNDALAEKLVALLFSPAETAEKTLTLFFQKASESSPESLVRWQREAVNNLRCPNYSEDVIKTWSRAPIEPLVNAAVQQLRPAEALVAQESFRVLTNSSERSSEQFSVTFAQYVELALHSGQKDFYGQALGYRNEFARRQALTLTYGRVARNASVLVFPVVIGAALIWKGQLFGWVAPLVIIGFVLVLFYARLVNHILDTVTWTRAAIDTLEILLGSYQPSE